MDMASIVDQLAQLKVIPVVAVESADSALKLADALVAGGLPCIEITFRTAAAADAIKAVAAKGNMLVGAGTVLTVDQAKQAVDLGARFLVSPGFSAKVVEWCVQNKVAITPGAVTPTEIQMALEFGLETVKFFPAEAYGGLETLKALAAPFGKVRFIPTGGITAANLPEYLAFPKVVACGGTWIATAEMIKAGEFAKITQLAAEAVKTAAAR
jgi:2-dehydro-3-deoxyphosphogluconate aldolase/(4S)-4-hydroxy-2-oxoglutarate aldolase